VDTATSPLPRPVEIFINAGTNGRSHDGPDAIGVARRCVTMRRFALRSNCPCYTFLAQHEPVKRLVTSTAGKGERATSIHVVEIHHHAIRIDGSEAGLAASLYFYQGLLGLAPDGGRPPLPGIPGFWINVGETGQIHLIGGEQPSRLAKWPDKDPVVPHVALAVTEVADAKAELGGRNVPY
jgi:hypothetical protein